jgi:glycosyltransferase involved in cell wall biosynthesis
MSQTLPRLAPGSPVQEAWVPEAILSPTDQHGVEPQGSPGPGEAATVVELALPVYNEESTLEASVRRLRHYLDESFQFAASIRIVDNASTDDTWRIACELAEELPGVTALHLDEKGKGRAIRAAWSTSTARIVAYMDVDLSTGLDAFLPLVAPLLSGHSDLSIGSRFAPGAHVLRGARREVVSRGYNFFLRAVLWNRFTDATCGFKAMRRETAEVLLPLVSDEYWFFDTELLVLAERNGFRIHEVPVDWIDDADSRVNVRSVAGEDLRGIARLVRDRAAGREKESLTIAPGSAQRIVLAGQTARYFGVGVLSTVVYLVCFFLLRSELGTYGADVEAFAISTVMGTFAHMRFTFLPEFRMRLREAAVAGTAAFVIGLALTTLAFGVEGAIGATSALSQVIAIMLGIVAASFVRLVLLRASAYRAHTRRR